MVLMLLPPAKADSDETEVFSKLSAPTTVQIEPVGRWFEARLHRQRNHLSTSYTESSSDDDEEESGEEDVGEEEDDTMLLTLDPLEWKNQDHYAVLGLSKLRYKATLHDIKKAHKQKVLKHHPDKREDRGKKPRQAGDDDYFSCITKAYEILGNPVKRRSYDSIDPDFNNDVPSTNQNSKDNFFKVFRPVFERNARWSIQKRVPSLGDENSTFKEFNDFYNFWYNFESWREFSYLDEEEKDKGECREERRWIDRQNRAARQQRKKEETARLRQLVDNAYACDPRIKRFKEEEKEKKAKEKRAKQEAARAAALELEKERLAAEEAERLAREKEEEAAKAKAQAAKKEKEALKKAMRKERKAIRETCKKYNYFTDEDGLVKAMENMERLCERLSLVRLQEVNEKFSKADEDQSKVVFQEEVAAVTAEIEQEHQEEIRKQQEAMAASKGGGRGGGGGGGKEWNNDDVQLLIKAANLFPPGTGSRYEVIANYINNHSTSGIKRVAKDIISKTKNLQKLDSSMKQAANEKAFEKFQQTTGKVKKTDEAVPSQKFEGNGTESESATSAAEAPKPWTTDEQKRLEQALKTFPAGPDRWDKIAEAVLTRSKKECMKRYKELVEMVKAKKAAQAQVAKSKKP